MFPKYKKKKKLYGRFPTFFHFWQRRYLNRFNIFLQKRLFELLGKFTAISNNVCPYF